MPEEINVSLSKIDILLIELKSEYGWKSFVHGKFGNGTKQITLRWCSNIDPCVTVRIGQNKDLEWVVEIEYDENFVNSFIFSEYEIDTFYRILQLMKEEQN